MPEADGPQPTLDQLLDATPEERLRAIESGGTGFNPERYEKVEQFEIARMRTALEQHSKEKLASMTPEEVAERTKTAQRYLVDQLIPPSEEGGNYAAGHWRNLFEMTSRIIDRKKTDALVPDVDKRVPFFSLALDKYAVVNGFLGERIQTALGEKAFTEPQLWDCFTNVSQEQIDTVATQIAQSGLPLLPESPSEHWAKIAKSMSSAGSKP